MENQIVDNEVNLFENQEVCFKVAMSKEARDAGDVKEFKTVVSMDNSLVDDIVKAAMKSYVIDLQGQIRNNWDKFLVLDIPETITFGQPLFGKKVKVVKQVLTPEELNKLMSDRLRSMSQDEILEFASSGKMPERFNS